MLVCVSDLPQPLLLLRHYDRLLEDLQAFVHFLFGDAQRRRNDQFHDPTGQGVMTQIGTLIVDLIMGDP